MCRTNTTRVIRVARYLSLFIFTSLAFQYTYASDDTDGDTMPDSWEILHGFDPLVAHLVDADADNDGLSDIKEFLHNTHPHNQDSEGDSLFDGWEVLHGFDPLIKHILTADADNDGLPDIQEFIEATHPHLGDTEGDAIDDLWEIINFLDPLDPLDAIRDRDGDGLNNLEEYLLGSDPNDVDSDDDGLNDFDEHQLGSNLNDPDSDDDGLNDLAESQAGTDPLSSDTDNDGLLDPWEVNNSFDPLTADSAASDVDNDGLVELDEQQLGTNPRNSDTDGDNLLDGWESSNGFDPLVANASGADTDSDGLSDVDEQQYNTNPRQADTDGDALLDAWEIANAFDPLVANAAGSDADNDGLTDVQEQQNGTNPRAADTDADLLLDGWEITYGLNPLVADDASADIDSDSLSNFEEQQVGTNPLSNDTDQDNLLDGWELSNGFDPLVANAVDADTDSDTLSDMDEQQLGTDPRSSDTDQDGLLDGWENANAFDPLVANLADADTDADGLTDLEEQQNQTDPRNSDTDADTLLDPWELDNGFDPLVANDASADTDGDGLTDGEEQQLSTNPQSQDTDSDSLTDGWENAYGFDPLVADDPNADSDNDGLSNLDEQSYGSNPNSNDTDGDSLLDGWEVSYGFDLLIANAAGTDTDGDGLSDLEEQSFGSDPRVVDTDMDGLGDAEEQQLGSNPTEPDTENDLLTDLEETQIGTDIIDPDTDDDSLMDGWEVAYGLDPLIANDPNADTDADGLTDIQEQENNTNPTSGDTDSDTLPDEWEVTRGTDPLTDDAHVDTDGDLYDNTWEYQNGTDPIENEFDDRPMEWVAAYGHGDVQNGLTIQMQSPTSVVVSPDGLHAVVSEATGIALFSRDIANGALSYRDHIVQSHTLHSVVFSNDGQSLYVLNTDPLLTNGEHHELVHYAFDQGALTEQSVLSFNRSDNGVDPWMYYMSEGLRSMLFSSDGVYLYLGTSRDGVIVFERDGATGALNFIQQFRVGNVDMSVDGGMYLSDDESQLVVGSGTSLHRLHRDVVTGTLSENNTWSGSKFRLALPAPGDFDGVRVSSDRIDLIDQDGAAIASRFILGPQFANVNQEQKFLYVKTNVLGNSTLTSYIPSIDGFEVFQVLDKAAAPWLTNMTGMFLDPEDDFAYGITSTDQIIVFTAGYKGIGRPDADADGVEDILDDFPNDPSASRDSDGDGLPDTYVVTCDFDCQAASTLIVDTDDDNDGVDDLVDAFPLNAAASSDFDVDGLPDDFNAACDAVCQSNSGLTLDNDDDNDGYVDSEDALPFDSSEWLDSDGDGVGNNSDLDDDNDGIPDTWELSNGLNPFNSADATLDSDGDSLTSLEEYLHGSDPALADTDGDGVADNEDEVPLDPTETLDADNDGIGDNSDQDDDNDGLRDDWELANGFDPLSANAPGADTDSDGLTDLEEQQYGTDPRNSDSDYDAMPDIWEVQYAGLDPLVDDALMDLDNDGYDNLWEYQNGTNPAENEFDDRAVELVATYSHGEIQNGQAIQMESPTSVVVSPDGLYAVVTDATGISLFSRDAASGTLSYLDHIVQPHSLHSVVFSNDGQSLYVLNTDSLLKNGEYHELVHYSFNDGELLEQSALLFNRSNNGLDPWMYYMSEGVRSMLFSSDGVHLYIGTSKDGVIVFERDGASGVLSFVQQFRIDNVDMSVDAGMYLSADESKLVVGEGSSIHMIDRDVLTGRLSGHLSQTNSKFRAVSSGVAGFDGAWLYSDALKLVDVDGATLASQTSLAPQFVDINSRHELLYLKTNFFNNPKLTVYSVDSSGLEVFQQLTNVDAPWIAGVTEMFLGPKGDFAYGITSTDQIVVFGAGYIGIGRPDTDGDGVEDIYDDFPDDPSAGSDTDGDGLPNDYVASCDEVCQSASTLIVDTDDDNDGVDDLVDAFPLNAAASSDFDGDGLPDDFNAACDAECQSNSGLTLDNDDDNDGYADSEDTLPFDSSEWLDSDGDGVGNNSDLDDDNDGIPDTWELSNGLDPFNSADATLDSDGDSLTSLKEYLHGSDPALADSDGDGVSDSADEVPLDPTETLDADNDGIGDNSDQDDDNDGLRDDWELANGFDPLSANTVGADTDSDGLTDLEEQQYGTDPRNGDTDYDTMPDAWEVQYAGLDPSVDDAQGDLDSDLYTNVWEYENGTNPAENEFDDRPMEWVATYAHGQLQDGLAIQIDTPTSVVVSPDGLFAVVTDATGIALFARDVESGELWYLDHVTQPHTSQDVVFSRDGESLYVLNTDEQLRNGETHNLVHYAFDNGVMIEQSVFNFNRSDNGVDPWMYYQSTSTRPMTFSQDGVHLYIGSAKDGIIVFERDSSSGALSFVQQFRVDNVDMPVDSGMYLSDSNIQLVAGSGSTIYLIDRDPVEGTLTLRDSRTDSQLRKVLPGPGDVDGIWWTSYNLNQVDSDGAVIASENAFGSQFASVNMPRELVYKKLNSFGTISLTAYAVNQNGYDVFQTLDSTIDSWITGLSDISVDPTGNHAYGITPSNQIVVFTAGFKGLGR